MTDCKSILVHVDSSPVCSLRLKLAHQLAEASGCTATALFAATPAQLQMPFAAGAELQVTPMLEDFEVTRRRNARAGFDSAVALGLKRLAWAELRRDEPLDAFAQHALYADLLVLGQHEPNSSFMADVPADFVESVLIASGRPAIVVPYIGAPPTLASTVLLAWKPTRESARALTAALPMMRTAAEVHVATWDDGAPGGAGAAEALDTYLRSHGVVARIHRGGPAPHAIGEHLLSVASDVGADLLVMGCYGHARAREWVMGGATRTVLASMTLPVLMVH